MRHGCLLGLGLLGGSLASAPVRADTDCVFGERAGTLSLRADCTTDATLFVPDGSTLDGHGHRIAVRDPAGGSFSGAVIRNVGTRANVRNLVIQADGLAATCHPSAPIDTRLRGILLQDASGTIADNQISIGQGASGCQEGDAIEVRTTPGNLTKRSVSVHGNRIERFQKTGILVLGSVEAGVYLNRIEGQGPVDFIAQNGIQFSEGAHGSIKWNQVGDVAYTGQGASSTGILVFDTRGPLDIALNRVEQTDVGLRLATASRVEIEGNVISGSTYDGIALDGRAGTTQQNRVVANSIADSGSVGIDLFGVGATRNLVAGNRVCQNGEAATQEVLDADHNLLLGNVCTGEELDAELD